MLFIDIAASFLISVLAGMGVGGGGLLVIYLSLVRNTEQLISQGINLLFFICASSAALAVNIKKRALNIKSILILSASGAVFAVLGAVAASLVNVSLLRKIFGGLLVISGFITFLRKQKQ